MTQDDPSRRFLDQLIHGLNTSALVSITDLSGRIVFANETFCKVSGYSESELIGADHRLVSSGYHSKGFFKEMWDCLLAGQIWKGEFKNKAKDGSYYWIESTIVPIFNSKGNIDQFISIRYDKTKQKQLEQELALEHAKSQHSMRLAALGEMAGGIAHEINNPLAIIRGRSDHLAILSRKGTLTHEKLIETTDKINTTVDRISKVVTGLRAFSRDTEHDPYSEASVAQIVQDTLLLCQGRLEKYQVKLTVFEIDPSIKIECHSTQISQVLLNLINNARDAVMDLGEKWIKIEVLDLDKQIEIRVTDSGLGIPDSVQAKIFEPFFTTKEAGHGSGMGLSISVGIIKDHQGILSLNTISDHTEFVICLPKRRRRTANGESSEGRAA